MSPAGGVGKEYFKRESVALREALLEAQRAQSEGAAVAVLIGGVEGSGKTESARRLLQWLDARRVQVFALEPPTDEERERPRFWRFWRRLPARGRIAFFLGAWHSEPIIERAFGRSPKAKFEAELERIAEFEAMLAREGVVLVKLWFDLTREQQRQRLEELSRDKDTAWRVTKRDWDFHRRYDEFSKAAGAALKRTSRPQAIWEMIDASDRRGRDLAAARLVLSGLRAAAQWRPPEKSAPPPTKKSAGAVLTRLDLSKRAGEDYGEKLEKRQGELARLSRRLHEQGRSLILVFEGADAAGKGGAIRRVNEALDPRSTRVIATAAPSEEERAQPYLWRFWRDLPRLGRVTIYDRSWYGRLLVERVEGFCRPQDWKRAYAEINAFESQLVDAGTILIKFWLAISPQEQLRRFKERQRTPYKNYKIGPDDWRNRAQWDAYEAAAAEMIDRAVLPRAPWVLIEAEDKRWARLKILKTVCKTLRAEL